MYQIGAYWWVILVRLGCFGAAEFYFCLRVEQFWVLVWADLFWIWISAGNEATAGRLVRPLAERAAWNRRDAKLFASRIPCFTLATACGNANKKPRSLSGVLYLGAWRWTTLAWHLPHYHRRGCVSLLSSEWSQVVPQRYCHQAKTVFMSLTSKLDRILFTPLTNTLGVVWLSLSGN